MGANCAACGGKLNTAGVFLYCQRCGAIEAVARKEAKYIPPLYLQRWLDRKLCGKEAAPKGVLLLESPLGAGKSAFFKAAAQGRQPQGESAVLYCDAGGDATENLALLNEALMLFAGRYGHSFPAPPLHQTSADKPAAFAQALNTLRHKMDAQGNREPLLCVIDNLDCGWGGRSRLLEWVPAPALLEEGVFVVVTANTELLAHNGAFAKRVGAIAAGRTEKLDRSVTGAEAFFKRFLAKRVFRFNFKRMLTDGDMAVEHALALVGGDLFRAAVLQQMLRDQSVASVFDLPKEAELLEVYFQSLYQRWGAPLFSQVLECLLALAFLNRPVEVSLLPAFAGVLLTPELLKALGGQECLISAARENGRLLISLRHYELCLYLAQQFPEQAEKFVERMCKAASGNDPAWQGEAFCSLQKALFQDGALLAGEKQRRAIASPAFWEASARAVEERSAENRLSNDQACEIWRARALYASEQGEKPLLVDACLRLEAEAEKGQRYNEAVYAYAVVISVLAQLCGSDPEKRKALAKAYLARSEIYARFEKQKSAIGDCTKAINIYAELYAKGRLERPEELAELYLRRGMLGQAGKYDTYIFDDYGRAIELLRQHAAGNPRKLASALLGRGVALNAKARYTAAVDDFDEALQMMKKTPSGTCDEEMAVAYGAKGGALCRLGRYAEGTKALSEAISLREALMQGNRLADPGALARAYVNRAAAYGEMDHIVPALEDNTAAIRIRGAYLDENDPGKVVELARAYLNRGVLYHKLGRTQEEVEDYTNGIRLLEPHVSGGQKEATSLCLKLYQYRRTSYEAMGEKGKAHADQRRMMQLQIILER